MGDAEVRVEREERPLDFGHSFVASEAFRALFREGMNLVEETAAYLDGPGRDQSRALGRSQSLTYAGESMRLTTRLMQIASWLLVHRAVAEGELTIGQALAERRRVRLDAQTTRSAQADIDALPGRLRELIALSIRLHARITHLDRLLSDEPAEAPRPRLSPVAEQQWLIRSAFGR